MPLSPPISLAFQYRITFQTRRVCNSFSSSGARSQQVSVRSGATAGRLRLSSQTVSERIIKGRFDLILIISFPFLKSNRVLVWLLAGAVVLGTAIRRRQWRRGCGIPVNSSAVAPDNVNVIQRIEKLEESLRSATTIIHMLSRQLEKLGIRFRVTRRTLKDPIAENLIG